MPTVENFLTSLPEDKEALKAMLRSLWQERDGQRQRAEAQTKRAEEHRKRADELYLENLQLQKELWRYKKATYGPRADRLSENELARRCWSLPKNWNKNRYLPRAFRKEKPSRNCDA